MNVASQNPDPTDAGHAYAAFLHFRTDPALAAFKRSSDSPPALARTTHWHEADSESTMRVLPITFHNCWTRHAVIAILFTLCGASKSTGELQCADHGADRRISEAKQSEHLRLRDSASVATRIGPQCRIVLETHATIGDRAAPRKIGPFASIAVTQAGDVLVGSIGTGAAVYRFEPNGRFKNVVVMARSDSGSHAERPVYVTGIFLGEGDTLFVADALNGSLQRVDPNGVSQVRMPFLRGIHSWVPIGGLRLFVNASIGTREAIGFPLHVIDGQKVLSSFGLEQLTTPQTITSTAVLAQAQDGTLLSAHRRSYRIESWSQEGVRLGVRTRTVEWFPPASTSGPADPRREAPHPQLLSVHDGGQGLLWITCLVPDPRWKPVPTQAQLPGMPFAASQNFDDYFDTVIEVIDIARNATVATYRDPRMLLPAGGGILSSFTEDLEGYSTYIVLRPRMIRVSSKER